MYLYNATFNVETEIYANWKIWLEEIFVVSIRNAQFHDKITVLEVLSRHQSGQTFTFQFRIQDFQAFSNFEQAHLPKLKEELFQLFADKAVMFDVMLREENEAFTF